MRGRAVVLAAAIVMGPLGAQGADLMVCWQKGFYAQRDGSISEIVAAFEQGIGKWLDCRRMDLENEVAKAIVAVSDEKRRLSSSIRSHQAKVSSGRDDDNYKAFYDYKAIARLKEAKNALSRLTTTKALREGGYALKEIKSIQQVTLHGSSGGNRAEERAKQAQAQLRMLSQAADLEALTGSPDSPISRTQAPPTSRHVVLMCP
jgi:hypothetical protein